MERRPRRNIHRPSRNCWGSLGPARVNFPGPLIRLSGDGLQRAEQALGHHSRLIMTRVSTFYLANSSLAALEFVNSKIG
jgi:hypothetical protein